MTNLNGLLLAHGEPAAGASTSEIVYGSIGAAVIFGALAVLAVAHRSGRTRVLTNLGALSERVTGLPAWASLPAAIAGGALLIAAFGFYWDVATHIDNGRDPGPFANPSHYFIIFGLLGLFVAGLFGTLLGTPGGVRTSVRIRDGWNAPSGAVLLGVCGLIAVMGFPLDDVWHRLFGQDVTLWGPTHIQMVGGAALSTLALWVLLVEGIRAAGDVPKSKRRIWHAMEVPIAGAFLIGLSALQAEFDYSVPQFRLLFHPVLLALCAGAALVPARIRLGRGGALGAVAFFIGVRGVLSLVIGPGFGHTTLHFPLYLAEALLVEAVALRVATEKQLSFGIWCGAAIGTLGVAAEWAWSHLWMSIPWPASLLPEAALAVVAGLAGGALGGYIGRALTTPQARREQGSRIFATATAAGVLAVLVVPLPIATDLQGEVRVTLDDPDATRSAATIEVTPASVAEDPLWFNVTAWQGGGSVLEPLRPIGGGRYRSGPVPIEGGWKTLIRLHQDNAIMAVPIYLPEDPAIPAEGVPAEPEFTRSLIADKEILLREAKDTEPWLSWLGYSILGAIVVVWIGILAWALARMDRNDRMARGGPRAVRRPTQVPT
ncbi:MAG TPA: hypothetical protein VJ927_11720 [Actinomycetota bacterium]|nr:hypothetical protein [Actinomycetota bacterium]